MRTRSIVALGAFLALAAGCGNCACEQEARSSSRRSADPDPSTATVMDPDPATDPATAADPATATDPDPAAATDARQALIASFRATRARTYRTRATMEIRRTGQAPRASTWTVEFVPPDRRRGVMEMPGDVEAHMLSIGSKVWGRRHGDDRWMPAPRAAPGGAGEIEQRLIEAIESGALRAERIGEDMTDGQNATVYAITWTLSPPQSGTMTGRVWIAVDGGLALRFEGRADQPVPSTIEMTYDYDESIRIEEPAPGEIGTPPQ